MSMELQQTNSHDAEGRETMYLLGGAAMIVFGAGLILSTPIVRKYLSGMGVGNVGTLVSAAMPDFQRYLKLRSM
jgi:hypothetical protein